MKFKNYNYDFRKYLQDFDTVKYTNDNIFLSFNYKTEPEDFLTTIEQIEKNYQIFEEKRKESLLIVKDLLIDRTIRNDFEHLKNQEKLVSSIKDIEHEL